MTSPTPAPSREDLIAEVANLQLLVEDLEEAALDAQRLLNAEDRGWVRVGGGPGEDVIDRDAVVRVSAVARVKAIADPLVKRGVNLRVAYLGVPSVAARDDDGGQDVNAVVQAFLDDPANRDAFTSPQACQERERARATDGNTFHALVTEPRTGRVQVRKIPLGEVVGIVTDPQDTATPWFYRREWTAVVAETGHAGSTRSRRETRRAYYPDINYRPATRARSLDGIPIEWDKPVAHTAVNRPEGSRWGTPDVLAALPWAAGYKDFLEDWARLHKALATVAFRATAKTRRGAAQTRERLAAAADGTVGGTVVQGEGQRFEAVNKSGATIDASSSKPLAAMVAAALDVPVTMLLTDPGVTGARATAETLDRPLELDRVARRGVDTDLITAVLQHVIREAVRAPGGPLRGVVRRDEFTGREYVTLAGDEDPGITVDWPSLDKIDTKTLIDALDVAAGMDLVPPLVIARLLLIALGEDNVDEVLDQVRDDTGAFQAPSSTVARAAGAAAAAAFRAGGDAAEAFR